MKKLNKLQINSEKIMKNEELVTLRGGYGGPGDCCNNICTSDSDCKCSWCTKCVDIIGGPGTKMCATY